METLAIIAYKQPISRAQVSAIRGVNVDGVVRTLEARGYIEEIGRDSGPGQAILYGTTEQFLERMGINSADDLPPVSEFVPGAEVVEALEQGLRIEADADADVDADADDDADDDAAEPDPEPDRASTEDDAAARRAELNVPPSD
jgi:segregation and condensation protein B